MSNTHHNLVNGNEAVAWAAIEIGLNYFSHYPGSPVNKIEPALKKLDAIFKTGVFFDDALNEHVATLSALGASLSGARSMVVMKHVGMNIAADPLNYIGYTGVNGGMLIVVGTDPGANCSTGEEDTHWFIPQINLPLFEPTSVKEIFHYTKEAYAISEKYKTATVMFIPARLCFNTDTITTNAGDHNTNKNGKTFSFKKDFNRYVNVGIQAVNNNHKLIDKIDRIGQEQNLTKQCFNENAKTGIITRGATFGHVYESALKLKLGDKIHLLNIDLVYPLNKNKLISYFSGKQEVHVIEDQSGFLENQLKNLLFNDIIGCKISGKETFPKYGEITFTSVYKFLADKFLIPASVSTSISDADRSQEDQIPERLGTFCEGCPHRASFYVLEKVLKAECGTAEGIIGGDIGCSSLPPQRADWLLCMNAGIGISQGMSQINHGQVIISTGGDGSLFHGGLISLISAVHNNMNLLHVVFDNEYIAMTGHQKSPTASPKINYRKLLGSIGIDKFLTANAFRPRDFESKLKKLLRMKGVRVLWVKGDCSKMKPEMAKRIKAAISPRIISSKCGTCNDCYIALQCPAITRIKSGETGFEILLDRCQRCRVCRSICEKHAIKLSIDKRRLAKELLAARKNMK